MKNQYYADSLDVAKWTVLARLATIHASRLILQIAMLTPDDRSKYGNRRDDPTDADPIVHRFFSEERANLHTSSLSPSINRVKKLGEMMSPPVSIEVIDEPFRHARRAQYFLTIATYLMHLDNAAIVLLDPDVGIAFGRATDRHVTGTELRQMWEAMSSGSVIVVFQHGWRAVGCRERAVETFAQALEIPPGEVTHFPYQAVSFLSAPKAGQNSKDLRNLVRQAWNDMADAYDTVVGTAVDFYRAEVIGPGPSCSLR